jgi:hypothetical protein
MAQAQAQAQAQVQAAQAVPAGYGGVAQLVVRNALAQSNARYNATGNIDVARELGLELEETQYNNRLYALTNPNGYAIDRNAEFQNVKHRANQAYQASMVGFIRAGLPSEMAKNLAMSAAANEAQIARQILEAKFPSNANAIGDASLVQKANQITGDLNTSIAPSRGSAPAPRAKAQRRRRSTRKR